MQPFSGVASSIASHTLQMPAMVESLGLSRQLGILMPGRGLARVRRLADAGAGPGADVRAHHRLDQVEHLVGQEKLEETRVEYVQVVEVLLPAQRQVLLIAAP